MKIGVSGLVSTGKTTLARALSQKLGYRLVEEGLPPQLYTSPPHRAARILLQYASEKRQQQNADDACVLDRTAIDIALLILNQVKLFGFTATPKAMDECRKMAGELDLLICLPEDSIPFDLQPNEAGLVRHHNPLFRQRSALLMKALAEEMVPEDKRVFVPASMTALEERLDFVLRRLG